RDHRCRLSVHAAAAGHPRARFVLLIFRLSTLRLVYAISGRTKRHAAAFVQRRFPPSCSLSGTERGLGGEDAGVLTPRPPIRSGEGEKTQETKSQGWVSDQAAVSPDSKPSPKIC